MNNRANLEPTRTEDSETTENTEGCKISSMSSVSSVVNNGVETIEPAQGNLRLVRSRGPRLT